MKFEASPKQFDLLTYIEQQGGASLVEHWMNTATITSLIRRQAIDVKILKRTIKLRIKPQGYFLLEFQPTDYYERLREVSSWRRR